MLAFAIIMLNTDLHTQALKDDRRMRCEDFIKNLRGVDDCNDIDRQMLVAIYDRIRLNEFRPASDHVSQVLKVCFQKKTLFAMKNASSRHDVYF